jgi:hypothetical protein
MTNPSARRREAKTISILTKRDKTKIQKLQTPKNLPVNTQTKSKRGNDKKTQKPKRNQSQKFSHVQPYRTKDRNLARSKNVTSTTKFWLTSSRSSEFGQNNFPHQPHPRQILVQNSKIKFPADQHSNTMPRTKQLDVIRLQQATVVNNLVEIARYTHTPSVYTEMTKKEFNTKIRNLDHISTLCIRSIRATRHGQRLAPRK